MKRNVIITCITGIALLVIAASPERSSSGAPASHTGAPNEETCAAAGCHDDNSLNSGTAALTIEMGDALTQYTAGQTYPIKVKIADINKVRFGFQLVALQSQTLANAGVLHSVDRLRTQTVQNTYGLPDRNYATYTFNGTDATANGQSEWLVNWTAPASTTGAITFYVAAVSANDDMTDKGDFVYTSNLTVSN